MGLELCSRGYRAALNSNLRLPCVSNLRLFCVSNLRLFCIAKLPGLFLHDFISYAGFAQGFGCRCVHFTSCACHVLTKGLWSSVGLTVWADAQGAKPEDLYLPIQSILTLGWVWGTQWFYTDGSGASGAVKKSLVQCHQPPLQYRLYILWLDMKIYSKLPEYSFSPSSLFKSF